ncbi:MAG: VOC family protein [Proteobacteria bacterium]|nr:VOC family protein [Pseudomonadota bacterium]
MEPSDPVQDIAHLGNIELLTPRIDLTTAYFRDLLGMEVVHAAGPSVFLRGYGDYAASTLKLTAAPRPGIGCISWRTTSPAALDRRVNAIEAAGRAGRWIDPECGRGPSFRFRDPDGHVMAIYYEEAPYRAPEHLRSTLKNLPMRYTGRGVNVRRIDHVALLSRDVAADRRFMEEVLGFRLREQVRFDRGAVEIGSWLSPSILHHQVAYVVDTRRVGGRLHHIALWVDNREDVLRAADICSEHGVFIEAGPAKHNNSQGFYLYAYEPGGNRIELYTGSFLVLAPDWRPVIWDEAERGTGVYWGGALPESFLSYATPDAAAAAPVDAARVPVFDPS